MTIADGKVIAGTWEGNTYYCLNASDGGYLWEFGCAGYAQGTPAYHDGRFFLTSWEYVGGHVYCVDAATGEEVWHADGKADGTYSYDACGSVCVADGKCFFTTYNYEGYGELIALNEADGSVAWGPLTIVRSDTTPAYYDGMVYISGGCSGYQEARTYCFDAADGSLVWQTPAEDEAGAIDVGNWTCSVAVADGKVFAGQSDGWYGYAGTYALDITDGGEVWHYDHGGASPAVAGGVVYTVGEGKVWAFDEASGSAYDMNGDDKVNVLDMIIVGNHFGETGSPYDINGDDKINVLDMIIVGNHFGE